MGGLWVFVIFWSSITLIFDGMLVRTLYHRAHSLSFVATPGTVVESEVEFSRSGKGGRSSKPHIHFTYDVNGTRYTGTDYHMAPILTPQHDRARRIVKQHPVGSAATVYYNPSNPQQACIQPGFNGDEFFLAMFLTPFNCVMLGMWSVARAGMRDRRLGADSAGLGMIVEHPHIRVRLPRIEPLFFGMIVATALAFPTIFILGFSFGGAPSSSAMLAILIGIYAFAIAGGLYWRSRISDGRYDLVVDKSGRYIRLPIGHGRKSQYELKPEEIADIVLVESSSSRESSSYGVTIRMDNGVDHRIADFLVESRATRLALWLKKRLPHLEQRRKQAGKDRERD